MREEREAPKKKAITFKATLSSFNEDESSEDDDEDIAMLIRKVCTKHSRLSLDSIQRIIHKQMVSRKGLFSKI